MNKNKIKFLSRQDLDPGEFSVVINALLRKLGEHLMGILWHYRMMKNEGVHFRTLVF